MIKKKKKSKEDIEKNKNEIEKQNKFFLEIWNERKTNGKIYSEVTNTRIYGECKTIYMHHILPKSKYELFKYYKPNIIIMTWDEHTMVENDKYKYDIINKKREELLEEYYFLTHPKYRQIGLQEGKITVEKLINLNQLI